MVLGYRLLLFSIVTCNMCKIIMVKQISNIKPRQEKYIKKMKQKIETKNEAIMTANSKQQTANSE